MKTDVSQEEAVGFRNNCRKALTLASHCSCQVTGWNTGGRFVGNDSLVICVVFHMVGPLSWGAS